MRRAALFMFLVWVGTVAGLAVNFVLKYEERAPIKIEAPPAISRHPVSGEFETGYILVEVWTTDGESEYPHIIRMRRSEYLEWIKQIDE